MSLASPFRLPLLQDPPRTTLELTAVEQFSRQHDGGTLELGSSVYRGTMPMTPPGPGQQYAFQVDLDACTGCKACVTACHSLNGLDGQEAEAWRSVGLLHGGDEQHPIQQTVTTACHHCIDPACMRGCPVDAYEKDPITGIVRHLDDQCIGCQYCTLTCPYEVPQYNHRLGIVRKCDMCSGRLSHGEPSACVQACPNDAISIRLVDKRRVIEDAQADTFLPGAPAPSITIPTTTYVSRHPLPRNVLPADFYAVRRGQNHLPLVLTLVLTQWSVGSFLTDRWVEGMGQQLTTNVGRLHATLSLAVGLLALGASILHLGRPLYAFRAVIGLRTSWLSREIVAFGVFAGAAVSYAATRYLPAGGGGTFARQLGAAREPLGVLVGISGITGIVCSVMVYAVTKRDLWSTPRSGFRFATTAAILGLATTATTQSLSQVLVGGSLNSASLASSFEGVAMLVILKLAWELAALLRLRDRRLSQLKRTAMLLRGELRGMLNVRVALGVLGGIVVPLLLALQVARSPVTPLQVIAAAIGCLLLVAGELLERTLYFTSVSVPRMPGGIAQ